ncbi:hypothetical protein D3C85_881910 [compost metagenome]
MQVANVLAVVADAIQIKVVAGIEAADTDAIKAGVFAAADVGDATQRLANVLWAILEHVRGFHRIDGLRYVPRRGRGTRGGGHVFYARVVRVGIGRD